MQKEKTKNNLCKEFPEGGGGAMRPYPCGKIRWGVTLCLPPPNMFCSCTSPTLSMQDFYKTLIIKNEKNKKNLPLRASVLIDFFTIAFFQNLKKNDNKEHPSPRKDAIQKKLRSTDSDLARLHLLYKTCRVNSTLGSLTGQYDGLHIQFMLYRHG